MCDAESASKPCAILWRDGQLALQHHGRGSLCLLLKRSRLQRLWSTNLLDPLPLCHSPLTRLQLPGPLELSQANTGGTRWARLVCLLAGRGLVVSMLLHATAL